MTAKWWDHLSCRFNSKTTYASHFYCEGKNINSKVEKCITLICLFPFRGNFSKINGTVKKKNPSICWIRAVGDITCKLKDWAQRRNHSFKLLIEEIYCGLFSGLVCEVGALLWKLVRPLFLIPMLLLQNHYWCLLGQTSQKHLLVHTGLHKPVIH